MPLQQAPPVTTAASHLEIMKLPKKRGRPPKGPDDFSPPPPVVAAPTSPAATSVSCKLLISSAYTLASVLMMAYSHCRTQTLIQTPVLCRIFSIGSISDSDPSLKCM